MPDREKVIEGLEHGLMICEATETVQLSVRKAVFFAHSAPDRCLKRLKTAASGICRRHISQKKHLIYGLGRLKSAALSEKASTDRYSNSLPADVEYKHENNETEKTDHDGSDHYRTCSSDPRRLSNDINEQAECPYT